MSASITNVADLSDRSIMGDDRLARTSRMAYVVAVISLIAAAFVAWKQNDPHGLAMIWLQNGIFVLTLSLGAFSS